MKFSETQRSAVHVLRVGWSTDASNFTVGEAPLSYGYGGTGKSSCNNKFLNYGEPFSTNDVIACYIDLDAIPKTIFFAKNGKYLDVAFRMGPEADGQVFYPHVTVKNMKFVANFGGVQPYSPSVQGFSFPECLPPHMLTLPPASPKECQDCDVLMMVGLPSCGKTTWLEQFVKNHPQKKYNVLGTNAILCKMKVMGLLRKNNYTGRWDALIKQATGILNEMLKVAQRKKRNYILDQTNVYPNARRRKMNNFKGYNHIAVVVVNTHSVLKERNDEVVKDGKIVPESAILEMKANFTLPVEGEIFNEVWYVEENQERSQQLVKDFNEEGRTWKEEQKKRPVHDPQRSEESKSDMKKPRYEGATYFNPPERQYGPGYHNNQTSGPYGPASNVANTWDSGQYGKPGGFNPSESSHGKREYSSYHKESQFKAPPPSHSNYHQPFSKKDDFSPNQYVSPHEDWQVKNAHQHPLSAGLPYYSDNQQNYGLQFHNQPQFHQPANYGRETGGWNTSQKPSYNYDQSQSYYSDRQQTYPASVQQQNKTQLYYNQGQYENYQ